jgi:regulator of sigma E protease
MLTAVSFLVVVGLVVVFHEFGHFVTAKLSGMKVRRFSVGFGPPIVSKKWGETVYSLAWFPIGGFVDIVGLDPEDQDAPGGFNSKPIGRRFAVLISGALMNAVLALIVFWIVGRAFGIVVATKPVVDKVVLPEAQEAGLTPGDRILSVNGQAVTDVSQIRQTIQTDQDGRVEMQVARDGAVIPLTINGRREKQTFFTDEVLPGQKLMATTSVPQWDETGLHIRTFKLVEQEVTVVGISFQAVTRPATLFEGVTGGLERTFNTTTVVLVSLKTMLLGQVPLSQVKGPIGIVQLVGEAAHAGIYAFLSSLAMISINIGILNIIPFPALDGGRLALLTFEAVRRRPLDRKKEAYVHLIGFAILLVLILAITVNDILHLLHGQQ